MRAKHHHYRPDILLEHLLFHPPLGNMLATFSQHLSSSFGVVLFQDASARRNTNRRRRLKVFTATPPPRLPDTLSREKIAITSSEFQTKRGRRSIRMEQEEFHLPDTFSSLVLAAGKRITLQP